MLAWTRPALGYAGSRERWFVTHPHPISMRKPEGMCCLLGDGADPGDYSEDSNLHLKERLPLGWKPQDSVSPGGGNQYFSTWGPAGAVPRPTEQRRLGTWRAWPENKGAAWKLEESAA